jgi:hypothetical protein
LPPRWRVSLPKGARGGLFASGASHAITGQILSVDAGWSVTGV